MPKISIKKETIAAMGAVAIAKLVDGALCFVAQTQTDFLFFEFDATGTDATQIAIHPYIRRPDDYVSAGVWKEILPIAQVFTEVAPEESLVATVAQLTSTLINTYGTVGTFLLTLQPAQAGLSFILVIGVDSEIVDINPDGAEVIYLDGAALAGGNRVRSTAANSKIGDFINFWTFKTGAATWAWMARTQQGVFGDGGA